MGRFGRIKSASFAVRAVVFAHLWSKPMEWHDGVQCEAAKNDE
jgi:hypothetical protein